MRNPKWDPDRWYFNYLGHPYFGAIAYVRARERGFGALGGFGYAALLSGVYEYGIEALFERPSYQDLLVTPVGGLLLGALLFDPVREHIRRKAELHWYDHVTLALTDPLGVSNRLVERLGARQTEIRVSGMSRPWRPRPRSTSRSRGRSPDRRNGAARPRASA